MPLKKITAHAGEAANGPSGNGENVVYFVNGVAYTDDAVLISYFERKMSQIGPYGAEAAAFVVEDAAEIPEEHATLVAQFADTYADTGAVGTSHLDTPAEDWDGDPSSAPSRPDDRRVIPYRDYTRPGIAAPEDETLPATAKRVIAPAGTLANGRHNTNPNAHSAYFVDGVAYLDSANADDAILLAYFGRKGFTIEDAGGDTLDSAYIDRLAAIYTEIDETGIRPAVAMQDANGTPYVNYGPGRRS
ncbi:hypothetical protein [Demequina silvatica]|uniref:hypothetical protein n=1 Tax=Demequina silvatica TaxID=1638988 RepID=UPI000780A5F6|nr:hypothetical protein [Demequina silvatica]